MGINEHVPVYVHVCVNAPVCCVCEIVSAFMDDWFLTFPPVDADSGLTRSPQSPLRQGMRLKAARGYIL